MLLQGTSRDSLTAKVLSPAGVTLTCEVVDLDKPSDDSTNQALQHDDVIARRRSYGIRFTPTQIGVYTVSVIRGLIPITGLRTIHLPVLNYNVVYYYFIYQKIFFYIFLKFTICRFFGFSVTCIEVRCVYSILLLL